MWTRTSADVERGVGSPDPGLWEDEEIDRGARVVDRIRFGDAAPVAVSDAVAVEEPLEIQLSGTSLAVVMRTPGHDLELVRGFLVSERVVERASDIASIRHCTRVQDRESEDNVVRVLLRPGLQADFEALRRNLYASSSCGICGKATIENALRTAAPLEDRCGFTRSAIAAFAPRLAQAQTVFARTGGLHGAGLFAGSGACLVVREDIGRHNAVDKILGWAVEHVGLPLRGHALLVSGRVSFEIVQKALAAGIPLVAAVSAPSSLAVELAQHSRMTLIGFLRGAAFNVYAGAERIRDDPGAR